MKVEKALILMREDLENKEQSFRNITHRDFGLPLQKTILTYNVVAFVDTDGSANIIKNRYGGRGLNIDVVWTLKHVEQCTERFNEAEQFLKDIPKWRVFMRRKVKKFFEKTIKKYDF